MSHAYSTTSTKKHWSRHSLTHQSKAFSLPYQRTMQLKMVSWSTQWANNRSATVPAAVDGYSIHGTTTFTQRRLAWFSSPDCLPAATAAAARMQIGLVHHHWLHRKQRQQPRGSLLHVRFGPGLWAVSLLTCLCASASPNSCQGHWHLVVLINTNTYGFHFHVDVFSALLVIRLLLKYSLSDTHFWLLETDYWVLSYVFQFLVINLFAIFWLFS